MNPGPDGLLEVRLDHRVHPGLAVAVDFRIGAGCTVLFGPSGAGKSTILRLIAGLTRPESGLVRLGGSTLFDSDRRVDRPLRSRRVGLIFQDDLLFPHLDVEGNVRFGLQGWPKGEAEARLLEVAGLCGVEALLGRSTATLSGGERQRVGLARALAPRPRVLLCDEPVSALHFEARHALIGRIRRVARSESIPVLYVTHSTDEAAAIGDRLLLLQAGRVVDDGPPLEVLSARGGRESIRVRNVFEATVGRHDPDGFSTTLNIVDGPSLVVPSVDDPPGSRLLVAVGAGEIVLARGPIGDLSARNLIAGTVDRVVRHGPEAEVLVRTGGVTWAVGVVATSVEALGLIDGVEVRMIVKARSCRVLRDA